MNKVQLKFYTQYLPVTNTINIYQDITGDNRDDNKYMELQCVLSKQNVYDDMTDKEFIKDIVSHFKKGLRDGLKERGILKDNVFVSFSKFPDLTAEKYLNGLSMILNDGNSWIA